MAQDLSDWDMQSATYTELRRHHDQMHQLKGSGQDDRWQAARPSASSFSPDLRSGNCSIFEAEPKLDLAPSPAPRFSQSRPLPRPPNRETSDRPRVFPRPPMDSQVAMGMSGLSISERPNARKPPILTPKAQSRSASNSNKHVLDAARKVSVPIIRYDIPQPYCSGPRYDSVTQRHNNVVDPLATASPDRNNPAFSLTAIDDQELPSVRASTLPTFSFTGPEDISRSPLRNAGQQDNEGGPAPTNRQRRRRPAIPHPQRRLVESGLNCANCYEPLGRGRIITANGRRYHPSHFLCFECGIPLEHVDFYAHKSEEEDDEYEEVYCHFDYHELFTPRCHYCTTPVIRDGIQALGKVYHAEHFFCALCSQTFTDDTGDGTTFVEKDDLAWHPKCYEEKFSTSYLCRKCKKKIVAGGQVITMGTGSHFHPECFQCAHCRSSLQNGFYWSDAKEGICKPCKEIEVKAGLV